MRVTYTIEINTDDAPPIIEHETTYIMSELFRIINDIGLPDTILKITRTELPEMSLEERLKEDNLKTEPGK